MKKIELEILEALHKNPHEFIDNDPLYTVWLDKNGAITTDETKKAHEAQIIAYMERDLDYPYMKQLEACEKHGMYDRFCEKFGSPLEWLEKQEYTPTPAFLACVVGRLVEQVEAIRATIKGV